MATGAHNTIVMGNSLSESGIALTRFTWRGSYSWLNGKELYWTLREGGEGENSGHKQVKLLGFITYTLTDLIA